MRAGLGLFLLATTFAARALAQDEPLPDELASEEPAEEVDADQAPQEQAAEEPAAPVDTWQWPGKILVELGLRVCFPPPTDFDRALLVLAYGDSPFVPAGTIAISTPAGIEWLWIGGRLGVRGRTWDHLYHEDASLVAVDLLAVVRARLDLGAHVELGLAVAGGLAWIGVWVNGAMADQFVPRFDVNAELAFSIGRHFALGPRVGWDYLQWSGINSYGQGVDGGGPYVGVGLEGRE